MKYRCTGRCNIGAQDGAISRTGRRNTALDGDEIESELNIPRRRLLTSNTPALTSKQTTTHRPRRVNAVSMAM